MPYIVYLPILLTILDCLRIPDYRYHFIAKYLEQCTLQHSLVSAIQQLTTVLDDYHKSLLKMKPICWLLTRLEISSGTVHFYMSRDA